MRALIASVLVAASLTACTSSSSDGDTSDAGPRSDRFQDAGDIAFVSDRGGTFQLYAMAPDGSGIEQLTHDDMDHSFPVWSPDGTELAFARSDEGQDINIFVLGSDGRTIAIADSPARELAPAWSPDGAIIAFASDQSGLPKIYTLPARGRQATPLMPGRFVEFDPVWSPDGGRIAFSRRDPGCPQEAFCFKDLYAVGADGRRLVHVTSFRSDEGEPAWSPDGTRLAYSGNLGGDNFDIFVINADGSGSTRLTTAEGLDLNPVWSPDGSHIAFTSQRDGNFEVYVMNADGSGQTNLTNNRADDYSPTWR